MLLSEEIERECQPVLFTCNFLSLVHLLTPPFLFILSRAYNLQDLGYDTVMANLMLNHGADERTYEVAQAILEDLGLNQIRLLTNNPDKIEQVEKDSQIKVVERVPMMPKSWEAIVQGTEADFVVREGAVQDKIVKGKELDKYLKVKVERMRHMISIPTAMA